MKVTKIETWHCRRELSLFPETRAGKNMPWDVVVLRLVTDAGVEGLASALAARSGRITEAYLHENIAPVVLGRHVEEREKIWQDLWTLDRHLTFFPVYLPGPVDVALWDAAAKAANQPLHRYLGSCRDGLPAYASGLFHDHDDDYVNEALAYKKAGIPGYKVHSPSPWRRDIEVHQAVREAVGDDFLLFCDPVGDYTLDQAIRVGRGLEDLGYEWFEEPFRDFELAKYTELCRALDIAVAATETTRGAHWGVAQAGGCGQHRRQADLARLSQPPTQRYRRRDRGRFSDAGIGRGGGRPAGGVGGRARFEQAATARRLGPAPRSGVFAAPAGQGRRPAAQ